MYVCLRRCIMCIINVLRRAHARLCACRRSARNRCSATAWRRSTRFRRTTVAGATVARPRGRPTRRYERSAAAAAAAAVAVSTAMSLSIRTYNGIRARCGATSAVATNDDGHGGGSDEPLARRTRNTHTGARARHRRRYSINHIVLPATAAAAAFIHPFPAPFQTKTGCGGVLPVDPHSVMCIHNMHTHWPHRANVRYSGKYNIIYLPTYIVVAHLSRTYFYVWLLLL